MNSDPGKQLPATIDNIHNSDLGMSIARNTQLIQRGWPAIQLIILLVALGLVAWLILAYMGVVKPATTSGPGFADPALLWLAGEHALIGIVLFAGIILSGVALLSLPPLTRTLTVTDMAILAVPIGSMFWLAVSTIVGLLGVGAWWVLIAGYGLPIINFGGTAHWYRGFRQSITEVTRTKVGISLPVILLGLALSTQMGIIWRFPSSFATGTVDLGDIGHYIATYHSLKINFHPLLSLAVEGEQFGSYFNQIASILALAFDFVPGFEISFFLTTSITFFFFLGVVWCIFNLLVYRRQTTLSPIEKVKACAIILLICAGSRYPSWIVESPPYAFAVPFTLAMAYMAYRGMKQPAFLYALLPLIVICFAISKVVVLAVMGAFGACCFIAYVMRQPNRTALILLACSMLVAGLFAIGMLAYFGPKFLAVAVTSDFGPPSLQILYRKIFINDSNVLKSIFRTLPTLAMDIGGLLLILGTWRLRNFSLAVATTLGVLLYFFYAFLFNGTLAIALVLVACWLTLVTNESATRKRSLSLLILSSALILYSHLNRDPAGWAFVLFWCLCLGGALVLVIADTTPCIGKPQHSEGRLWRYVLPVVMILSSVGLATGAFQLGQGDRQIVPPKLYDIWGKIQEMTPPDALIFTDQTGDRPTRLEGWNDLSVAAERQFYLSSWAASPLRGNPTALHERLRVNAAVLDGQIKPEALELHRQYSSYFLAIRADRHPPEGAVPVYDNGEYAIYRLP